MQQRELAPRRNREKRPTTSVYSTRAPGLRSEKNARCWANTECASRDFLPLRKLLAGCWIKDRMYVLNDNSACGMRRNRDPGPRLGVNTIWSRDWTNDWAVRKARDAGKAMGVFPTCSQGAPNCMRIHQPTTMRRIPIAPIRIMIAWSNGAIPIHEMTACNDVAIQSHALGWTYCKTMCLPAPFSTLIRTESTSCTCPTSWPQTMTRWASALTFFFLYCSHICTAHVFSRSVCALDVCLKPQRR